MNSSMKEKLTETVKRSFPQKGWTRRSSSAEVWKEQTLESSAALREPKQKVSFTLMGETLGATVDLSHQEL